MHDPAARVALQECSRQQADDVIALDEPALLVEEKATVVVAVPGDGAIGAVLAQRLDRCRVVLDEHRVRHAVRERAVRLVVHLDELEWQVLLELVDDQAGTAVACVHHDLQAA